jgi:hypothetical protein
VFFRITTTLTAAASADAATDLVTRVVVALPGGYPNTTTTSQRVDENGDAL